MASFPGWDTALLQSLGAPPTKENLRFLNAWTRAEGGSARYNPLNTTQHWKGASSYNSVGVRNYQSAQSGLQATLHTLNDPRYQQITSLLRSGRASAVALGHALARSPWGTGQGVLRVLGSGASGAAQALPAATPSVQAAAGSDAMPARTALARQLISNIGLIGQNRQPDFQQTFSLIAKLKAPGSSQTLPVIAQGTVPAAKAAGAVALAKHFLGTPYRWGGSTPKTGFDCSGLLQYVWAQKGVRIPRTSQQQFHAGTPVGRGQLRAGDAVFFGSRSGPHHVGMMIDRNHFIEAPHTGAVVRISDLRGRSDFTGARRFA